MTRWLITGAGGALGTDLRLRLAGEDIVGLDHAGFDLSGSAAALQRVLDDVAPDVVINTGAYTRVDDAETDEALATTVNGTGPGVIATWCAGRRVRLIHVSTDYVFPGDAITPYDVDAPTGPASAYGRSKLAGEAAVLAAGGDGHVVRTAWLYGAAGTNFIRTIATRLRDRSPVQVVDDQIGAPTWTRQLADRLVALATAAVAPGIWHCTNAGAVSWFEVATTLGDELGVDPALISPTTSATFGRPAPRPAYSVLSNQAWIAAGLPAMPDWREALHEALPVVAPG
jgi:dTDP-4-dehydrorhamnose reductase